MLVNIKQEECRNNAAQRHGAIKITHLYRLHGANQARIVQPLHSMKFSRCPALLLPRHSFTFYWRLKRLPLSLHTAVSRFATADYLPALLRYADCRCWT